MKISIIDDEVNSIRVTKNYLQQYPGDIEIIGEYTDPIFALKDVVKNQPDLIFLDIEMPGLNGFEFLDSLDLDHVNVVFVTAYDQYAIKAIKCSAIDYILKPFSLEDLSRAIEKAKEVMANGHLRGEAMNQKKPEYIVIPGLREYTKVNLADIVYAEGQRGGYTIFYQRDGVKTMASKPLAFYNDVLDEFPFIKIHKSHIVNINEMKKFNSSKFKLYMTNGTELDLAHRRKSDFLKFLKEENDRK